MDYNRTWFAFLSAEIIRQCIDNCVKECPACINGILSPLLHHHNELNLHQKMERYISRVEMNLSSLFDRFVVRFGWFTLDREQFVNLGQAFVDFSTPDAIFYGKYITYKNDFEIYGGETENELIDTVATLGNEKVIKGMGKRRKKNVIIENDIFGSSVAAS